MLVRCDDEFPAALAIVTADRGLVAVEGLAREAGAAWFVSSIRQLPTLVAVIERHFVQQPQPAASVRERIWKQLPWDRAG